MRGNATRQLAFLATLLLSVAPRCEADKIPLNPTLPQNGIYRVSQVGQAGQSKAAFDELWAAFREQYVVDEQGNVIQMPWAARWADSAEDGSYAIPTRKNSLTAEVRTADGVTEQGKLLGRCYSAAVIPQRGNGTPEYDSQAHGYIGIGEGGVTEFYPLNPKQAVEKVAVLEVLSFSTTRLKPISQEAAREAQERARASYLPVEHIVQRDGKYYVARRLNAYRQAGTLADTKELQDAFVAALRTGAGFRVMLVKHIVCPEHRQNSLTPNCSVCKGTGGLEAPQLITLKW